MKQFLQKTLEVLRGVLRVTLDFVSWLVAFLRSVNIDQPRGVILCVTFQLVVAVAIVLAFRNPVGPLAKPLEGQSQPQASPEVIEDTEPQMPDSPLPSLENQ